MKKYNLRLNEVQANMLQRVLKDEILKQRKWELEEKSEYGNSYPRAILSAQMWDLIEQLCSLGVDEYWEPLCMQRTDEEQDEYDALVKFDEE